MKIIPTEFDIVMTRAEFSLLRDSKERGKSHPLFAILENRLLVPRAYTLVDIEIKQPTIRLANFMGATAVYRDESGNLQRIAINVRCPLFP